MRIELLVGAQPDEVAAGCADVLVDCVAGGASVGFLDPLDPAEAQAWWRRTLADPQTMTWVGRDVQTGRIVGTVRLILAGLPNAPHRAEVSKLLVHRSQRGRGAGSALMSTVEEAARRLGAQRRRGRGPRRGRRPADRPGQAHRPAEGRDGPDDVRRVRDPQRDGA